MNYLNIVAATSPKYSLIYQIFGIDVADLILHQFRGLLLVAAEELDVVLDQQFLHMGRLPSRFFSALIDWFVF